MIQVDLEIIFLGIEVSSSSKPVGYYFRDISYDVRNVSELGYFKISHLHRKWKISFMSKFGFK